MVARITANLPDAVIRFHPTTLDGEHHLADQVPVRIRQRVRHAVGNPPLTQIRDQLHHRAENVQLHLGIGGIPDPHGTGTRVAGQRVDHRLGTRIVPDSAYSGCSRSGPCIVSITP